MRLGVLLLMSALHATSFGINSTTDGMEIDDFNGTGMSINTTGGVCGQGSLKIGPTIQSATKTGAGIRMASATKDRYYVCGYLKFTSAPNVLNTILEPGSTPTVSGASTVNVRLRLKTDGALELFDVTAGTILYTHTAFSSGTRYRIELFLSSQEAGGSNQVKLRIDSTSDTFSSTNRNYSTNEHSCKFGGNLNGETCTSGEWEWSDIVFHDEAGTTQNSWPGAGALSYHRPDAAGDFNEGAVTGAATSWQAVNENPPDDDTSYHALQTDSSAGSGSADRLDVSIEGFPAASNTPVSVEWVGVLVRAKPASNASCSFVPRVKGQASGTVAEGTTTAITGTAYVTNDDTSTTKQLKLIRTTNPQTSAAWGVDPSGWQIGVRAPDGNPDVRITNLLAVIRHVPGAPSGGGANRRRRAITGATA